jgi:O-antigen ligase
MSAFSVSRPRPQVGGFVRLVVLAGSACAIGLVCGRLATTHYGLTAVEALIAVPILIATFHRPFVALMLLLVLLASVAAYGALPRAHVPGGLPLNIGDLALAAAVGGTLWRRPWRVWPPAVRRFFVALAFLLLLATIPTIRLAVLGHDQARSALVGYKTLLYLAVTLTVALELSARLWWPLVNAAIAFAAVVSILSILVAASSGLGHLLSHVDATVVAGVSAATGATGSTSRIRLPGLFFVYAMTIPTLVMVLVLPDRWRSLRVLALLLMISAIAISLNRNMYFGGAIGLVVTLLVGGPRLRHRALITAVTVVATLVLVISSAVMPAVTAQIGSRAQSALSSQVLSSGSAQARSDEFSHALDSIAHHPWYGVGWFQNYGSYVGTTFRQGVEDLYLDLATDLGLPVALAFLLVPATVLLYGLRRARTAAKPSDRALVAAGIGSVIALLLSCLVGTYLQDPGTMMMFGVACALLLGASLRATPRGAERMAAPTD